MGFTLIFSILRRIWPYLLALALIMGIYFYWHGLVSKIDDLQKDKVVLEQTVTQRTEERDLWIGNYKSLQTGLQAQTEILKGLKKSTDDMKKSFGELNTNVNNQVGSLGIQLSTINKLDLSKLTDKQAIDYLRNAAQGKR